jgi:hypothetical protein
MKILAMVKFNEKIAFVLDETPSLTWFKVLSKFDNPALVGTTENNEFASWLTYRYANRKYSTAFAGREILLPMKDGTTFVAQHDWWDNTNITVEMWMQENNLSYGSIVCQSIDNLSSCYVFNSYQVEKSFFDKMVKEYVRTYGNVVHGYHDFEEVLNRRKERKR